MFTERSCQVASRLLMMTVTCSTVSVGDDVVFVESSGEELCSHPNSYNSHHIRLSLDSIWLTSDYSQSLYLTGNLVLYRYVL